MEGAMSKKQNKLLGSYFIYTLCATAMSSGIYSLYVFNKISFLSLCDTDSLMTL